MNNFAYIEKTMPKLIDKVFARESLTDFLIGGSEIKLDFLDAKTVKIFKMTSTGLTDYQRGGHGQDNTRGAVGTSLESFTLTQERYSEIPLDKLDELDDGETVIGHLGTEFVRTKIVPEVDAYRFSKMVGYTNTIFGNRVEEEITANTIITKFNEAFEWFADRGVPEDNQVIYVNPHVMTLIRNTSELYKHLSQSEYKDEVSFSINKYENRQIIVVPSDRFFTDIKIGNGFAPDEKSKTINFLIVDKSAPIPVKKLDFSKIYSSIDGGTYLGFAGYLFTNLLYHDLFIPDEKVVGVYASVSTQNATAKANALLINAEAGSGVGKTKIVKVLTSPAGTHYDKIFTSTTAITIGAATTSLTEVKLGEEFTPNATHNYFAIAHNNKVIAISKDFPKLPVGA